MFFSLSKTLGLLVQPLNLALVLLVLWLLLRWRQRAPRLRRFCFRLALGLLVVFSLPLTAQLLLHPLESAHPREPKLGAPPVAIAMLTGMTDIRSTGYELTEAGDRIVETVRLAHRYPRSRVLLLGGSGSLIDRYHESVVLARLAVDLGIERKRIIVDTTSRNTHENAVEGAELLRRMGVKKGTVLLVTSASHMTRALACFAKSYPGPLKIVPWPVDFQHDVIRHSSFIPRPRAMIRSRRAINEYVGMITYWLLGYL
ncbi:MAG: YdcF family protein [Deltaproteobacteria bacterium]|nr:YdcF family protein [Deltaproteobacteria bacterium]